MIPLKVVSILPLELAAAIVVVKLSGLIPNELEYPIHNTIYWTDSTILMQYIPNKSRFQMIVVNRIVMIHHESTSCQLQHIDTWGRFQTTQDGAVASWPQVSVEGRTKLA